MKITKYILFFTFCTYFSALSSFKVDYSILKKNETSKELLLYYSVNYNDLKYQRVNSEYISISNFDLYIIYSDNKRDTLAWADTLKVVDTLNDNLNVNLFRYTFEKKITEFQIKLQNQSFVQEKKFLISDFTYQSLTLSKIILLYNYKVNSEDLNSKFTVNKNHLIPKADNDILIYSKYDSLKFYVEIYKNIGNSEQKDSNLIRFKLFDAANREVMDSIFNKSFLNEINTYCLSINMLNFPTGIYYLQVLVGNNTIPKIIESEKKKIYLINSFKKPNLTTSYIENRTFEKSEYSSLNEKQLEEEYQKMKIILNNYEKSAYSELSDLKSKQKAIYQFWLVRDPDTSTFINEFWLKYQDYIDYANRFYSMSDNDGWHSDRGKTLLKYGFPTHLDRYPQKGDKKAAEEWLYTNIRGGVYFFFVDINNTGDLRLVHSSLAGEIQNFDWFNIYNPAIENDGSSKYSNPFKTRNR